MADLRVYFDLMSQPSRAVVLFLKVNNIPFTEKPVALRHGEHLTEEFGKINPMHLVPVIDDNGFILTESIAILKYVYAKYDLPDHWYPKDLKKRAKVDEYLSWYHLNTRIKAALYFRTKLMSFNQIYHHLTVGIVAFVYLYPRYTDAILRYLAARFNVASHWYPEELESRARVDEFCAWYHNSLSISASGFFDQQVIEPQVKNIPVDQERLRRYSSQLDTSLSQLENIFLKDHQYLAGDDISIADLMAACEVMAPYASGYDIFEGHPKIQVWLETVKQRLNPHFDDLHIRGPIGRIFDKFNPSAKI